VKKNVLILLVLVGLGAGLGGFCRFEFGDPNRTCTLCHEIRGSQERMAASPHKDVNCKSCHGGTLEALGDNVKRAVKHLAGADYSKFGSTFMLSEKQVDEMCARCEKCHRAEAAQWKASGHGKMADVFLQDKDHNAAWKPADQCLRCHGMFLEGDMDAVVKRTDLASRHAVPCLACHTMHADENLAFYSRVDGRSFPAWRLSMQTIVERDGGRPLRRSPDACTRLCSSCHAANAEGIAGSGDDRTPTGAQEGMACTDCHYGHGRKADASRGRCPVTHPKKLEKMKLERQKKLSRTK